MSIEITGISELQERFAKLGDSARDTAKTAVEWAQNRIRDVLQGSMRGQVVIGDIDASGNTISGTVGIDEVYARVQNDGGVVTAKNAEYLTIPVGPALGSNGAAKYTARDLISNPAIGGFTGAFAKHGVMFGKTSYGIEPVFVLKRSVTIPPKHYMEMALDRERGAIETRFAEVIGAMAEAG